MTKTPGGTLRPQPPNSTAPRTCCCSPTPGTDHALAAALAAQGFPVIGTTSLGVAEAAGLPDGALETRDETPALGTEPLLLSVDAEGGFGEDPDDVAEFARELRAVGAVGINLADGRERAHGHVLAGRQGGTLSRVSLHQQAGPDGVFVPGLSYPTRVSELVAALDVPLTILYSPTGPTVGERRPSAYDG